MRIWNSLKVSSSEDITEFKFKGTKMAKQTLKDIQDAYSAKLDRIKTAANEENVALRERLELAKVKIAKLVKQIEKLEKQSKD